VIETGCKQEHKLHHDNFLLKNGLITKGDFCSGPNQGEEEAETIIGEVKGCHPSFTENPILVSLWVLAICLIAGSLALTTNMSMKDSIAGAVVLQDNGA
jgi:hypothetical protein